MLSQFYIVVEDFQVRLKECDRKLAKWQGVNHFERHRMVALGNDMVRFSDNLVRAYINATMWQVDQAHEVGRDLPITAKVQDLLAYVSGSEQLDPAARHSVEEYLEQSRRSLERMIRRHNSRAAARAQEAAGDLMVAYKAYFFFIRAFHDACYRVLLNLGGQPSGKGTSMWKCVSNPASAGYAEVNAIPGYIDWFKAFRAKRNAIKDGVECFLCGPQWDVAVGFNKVKPDGGVEVNVGANGDKVRIGDLIDAFQHSDTVVKLISATTP